VQTFVTKGGLSTLIIMPNLRSDPYSLSSLFFVYTSVLFWIDHCKPFKHSVYISTSVYHCKPYFCLHNRLPWCQLRDYLHRQLILNNLTCFPRGCTLRHIYNETSTMIALCSAFASCNYIVIVEIAIVQNKRRTCFSVQAYLYIRCLGPHITSMQLSCLHIIWSLQAEIDKSASGPWRSSQSKFLVHAYHEG
jgi:hypothetical protein